MIFNSLTDTQKDVLQAHEDGRVVVLDYGFNPKVRNYGRTVGGQSIVADMRAHSETYLELLRDIEAFGHDLKKISVSEQEDPASPYWLNGWLPGLDAAVIYTLIRKWKPKTYFEIGSGNSTKFARRAIQDGGLNTRIVSVDPMPRAEIDRLCDQVIRSPFEDLEESAYLGLLQPGDVVFVDNSHRSFQSSDVTVFFTEMLPALPKGTIWGVHDIFIPDDYPQDWLGRFYNEQYLLVSYLLGGHFRDSLLFPTAFVSQEPALVEKVHTVFSDEHYRDVQKYGGGFWMRRN